MQRIPRHSLLATLLAFLSLIAVAILPSVASAAPATCPNNDGIECILVISAPDSVPSTGEPFTVKVAVTTDGKTVAKGDACASTVHVDLLVWTYNGALYAGPTLLGADASNGIATFTFPVPLIPAGSVLFLEALASVPEVGDCSNYDYQSDDLYVGQTLFPCPDNVAECVQAISGGGSAATLFAETGSFVAAFQGGDVCSDGGPADPNGVLSFAYTGGNGVSVKTIVLALSPALVTKGIGQYKICYESPTFGPGYLAACSKSVGPPCVLFQTSTQHNGAFFGIQVPPGDPFLYPR